MRPLDENTEIPIFTYKKDEKEYAVIPGKFIEKYLNPYYYIKGIMNYQIDKENLKEGTDLFRIYNLKEYENYYSYYTNIDKLKYDFFITEKAFDIYIEKIKGSEENRIKKVKEKYKNSCLTLLKKEAKGIEDLNALDLLRFDGFEISNIIKELNRVLAKEQQLDEFKFYSLLDSKFKIAYEIQYKEINGMSVPQINKYITKDCLICALKSLESARKITNEGFISFIRELIVDSSFRGIKNYAHMHAYYVEEGKVYI